MSEKFTDESASRIISALDARSDRKTKSGAQVQTTWGKVGAVDAYNKVASAYLYGETDGAYMSEGFRIPETMYLSVNDVVRVAINYATGDRWIEEVNVPATAYKKVAINVATGEILQGDGTVPPVAASGLPSGAVILWTTNTPPTGFLLANGQAVSRSTYAALFAAIGTTYGSGDGSTTFNVPNLVNRFPYGRNAEAIGGTGGATTHTHGGHSNHAVTQPSAHAALSHSAHSGTAVGDHAAQAHSAHSGTAVSAHAAHTHDTPFIDNGAQTLSTTQSVFGSSGTTRTRDWTGSFTSASGSYAPAEVSDTTVGAHTVTQPSAHSDHPLLSHSVTQPSAHSDHASQTHTGTAVDAHSAHDSPSHLPPYIILNYIIKT